jgi:hypothetical protein
MKRKVFYPGSQNEVLLNSQEQQQADFLQNYLTAYNNDLGAEISITNLTQISKLISEQKFYKIKISDYLPIIVGEGAFATSITTFREFLPGNNFEEGVIDLGQNLSRLTEVDAQVDSDTVKTKFWARGLTYSILELQSAMKAGNWSLIEARERSRKTNWDLGIQETAFWGLKGDTNVKGLLTLSGVNSNTALITEYIKGMSTSEFQSLLSGIIGAYRSNCNFTEYPNTFVIPELDYSGLASSADETYPLKSRLERLREVFATITQNPNFVIKPCSYADQANNAAISGLNKNRYVLYNSDPKTLKMNIPIDYTNTLANTINGLQFQSGAYGQFTGVQVLRTREVLYFDWAA